MRYHLAVAGGYEVLAAPLSATHEDLLPTRLRTHPLPRGGTDLTQASLYDSVAPMPCGELNRADVLCGSTNVRQPALAMLEPCRRDR